MTDHPAGTVKHHPDWPAVREIAMRTDYVDGQYPGWTSWMLVRPSGSEFVDPAVVADWPQSVITGET